MKIHSMIKVISLMVMLWCGFAMAAGEPMVLKYNTALSTNTRIKLELNGNVNATIDWGDGNSSTSVNGPVIHEYDVNGTYTVSISGTVTRFGSGTFFVGSSSLIEVVSFGDIGLTSLTGAFMAAGNLTKVPATIPPGIKDLTSTFYNAISFKGDISKWDVSAVTKMDSMFYATAFNGDIKDWDVSKVTSMEAMFSYSRFNNNIENWNVSNVTDMSRMFDNASYFNQPIGSWNVSKVEDMLAMFADATSFNQDLNKWNVSNVIDMDNMFTGASAFNGNIEDWDVSSVKTFVMMFVDAKSFNQNLEKWNVSNASSMMRMFFGSQLSVENYSALLTSWSKQSLKSNVIFHGGASKYSLAAANFRKKLVDTYQWNITDGGPATEQTITSDDIDKQYGDASFTVSATASSSLPITFTSSNEDVATIDNGVVTIVAAGTAEITASQIGDYTIAPATSVATLTVAKAPLTVTATAETITVGETPKLAYAITTGQLFGTDKFTGTLTADYSKVGSVDILQGTLSAGDNYNISFVPAKLTVNAKTTGLLQTPSVPMIDLGRLQRYDLKGRLQKEQ